MRIDNKSDFPTEIIKDAIRFARPAGIKRFKVTVRNYSGRLWSGHGNAYGALIKINQKTKFPRRHWTYQYGQLRGRRYYFASIVEVLIYILAHELMHTRQGQGGRIRGRVWGARGRFSEIETDSYAIRKVREWRRSGHSIPPIDPMPNPKS
jgi:hypothetical protein